MTSFSEKTEQQGTEQGDLSEVNLEENTVDNAKNDTGTEQTQQFPKREAFYLSTGVGAKVLVPGCWGYFNVALVLAAFAFFLFNAVVIIGQYVQDTKNPPVSTDVRINQPVPIPTIVMCNGASGVPFDNSTHLSLVEFTDDKDSDLLLINACTSSITGVALNTTEFGPDCMEAYSSDNPTFENFKLKSALSNDVFDCLVISGFPGFGKLANLKKLFPTRLTVTVFTNIGSANFTADDSGVQGVRFFVFPDFGSFEIGKQAGNIETMLLFSDNNGLFAMDQKSFVGITKNELQYFEDGDETVQLDIFKLQISSANLIETAGAGDVVSAQFMYSDNRVVRTEQKKVKFSVALGSLGGW
eukprot:CAMPEP_0203765490 /NCGR_PEP_ID=MMETSP0098-20131031/18439_1 /ASSEMBLY_ACC=CAM_ASM_000208 /TAXON_ID=96639 /ORGANISM=" , Strain NY0313808BC1" /LENGTH=355 /DNA_ID=CAMNT_0050661747 /DNA_START=234 /DNA_END=1298 /DNA_ORIENTATION=+